LVDEKSEETDSLIDDIETILEKRVRISRYLEILMILMPKG
jgi:hypothetical protein